MVKTKITKIDYEDNYIVVHFRYFNVDRFTYLTKLSQNYWLNRFGHVFNVGDTINVTQTLFKGERRFQIIGIDYKK